MVALKHYSTLHLAMGAPDPVNPIRPTSFNIGMPLEFDTMIDHMLNVHSEVLDDPAVRIARVEVLELKWDFDCLSRAQVVRRSHLIDLRRTCSCDGRHGPGRGGGGGGPGGATRSEKE